MNNQERKARERLQIRDDALKIALKIVKESGIEGLEKEIEFRGCTGVSIRGTLNDLDLFSEPMRSFLNEAHILIWLSVLHDEFDFGAKRLNQAMDRFEEIYSCINEGYAGFFDYEQLLEKKMRRIIKTEHLKEKEQWEKNPEK